jgi:hypothetical protein
MQGVGRCEGVNENWVQTGEICRWCRVAAAENNSFGAQSSIDWKDVGTKPNKDIDIQRCLHLVRTFFIKQNCSTGTKVSFLIIRGRVSSYYYHFFVLKTHSREILTENSKIN